MIGQTVAHYEVLEKLGAGGMGVVYRARDTKLGRDVALKFLPPHLSRDETAKARFIKEAQASSALDHANICTIFEIGESGDGQSFIVMAYYPGTVLKRRLVQTEEGIPVEQALDIALQVCSGLQRAHEHGIVHRDIHPGNIMLTERGEVKILDFGIAKLASSQLTTDGTPIGTAAYMSPEQARGLPVDQRTDVWSLGIVLYEMLAGKRPFTAEFDLALLYSVVNVEPRPLAQLRPDVPAVLARIVDRCLAKEAEARFQSIEELARELEQAGQSIADGQSLNLEEEKGSASTTGGRVRRGADGPLEILVVDDEPAFELLMKKKFRRRIRGEDWVFHFAKNGLEALDALQSNAGIELVLTDLNMPEMGGLTLLAELEALNRLLKPVVISAYDDMENIRTAMNRGAFDFVTKPVDFADLERTIIKTQQELDALRVATSVMHTSASLEDEWQSAHDLHDAISPAGFPRMESLDVFAFSSPAGEITRDFYDVFAIDGGRYGFFLGGAPGSPVAAAVAATMARPLLRTIAERGGSPNETMRSFARALSEDDLDELGVSVLYGTIDSTTRYIRYCNSGLSAAFLIGDGGGVAPVDEEDAAGDSTDSGPSATSEGGYRTAELKLRPGEKLLLFTRGITSLAEKAGPSASPEHLASTFAADPNASAAGIVRDIVEEVSIYAEKVEQLEDVTVMVVKRLMNDE